MAYKILHSVCEVPVDAPAEGLDLPNWLFSMSDEEYQRCSKSHIAAGASILPDGTKTSVNVERVGGHLMVQHYVPEIEQADRLKLVSHSDCWLFHIWYVRLKVTWDTQIVPMPEGTSIFRNAVTVEHGSPIVKLLTPLVLGGLFLKKHNAEETPRFAESLVNAASIQSRLRSVPL